jgi:hypothetical protein
MPHVPQPLQTPEPEVFISHVYFNEYSDIWYPDKVVAEDITLTITNPTDKNVNLQQVVINKTILTNSTTFSVNSLQSWNYTLELYWWRQNTTYTFFLTFSNGQNTTTTAQSPSD